MTWIVSQSGTTAALTLGSETTLGAADTNNATFVLEVDTSNMVNADVLEIRLKTVTLGGGSTIGEWKGTYANLQVFSGTGNNHKVSPFVASDQSVTATLRQVGGTLTITSVTGTIPSGSTVTGQTSGTSGIVYQLGGGNVSGSSTTILITSTGTFVNGETVQLSVGNNFVINAAPNGRTYAWKLLRQ
jgi:hypothetical protein